MSTSETSQKSFAEQVPRLSFRLSVKIPIVQGVLRGRWWIAGSSDYACWLGNYRMEKQESLLTHLHAGNIFYDMGAQAGFFTLLAAHIVGEQGHVYAFENCLQKLYYLKEHIRINRFSNVTILDTADEVGIDSLVAQGKLLPPNVININVPGSEAQILQGAFETLSKHIPVLFINIHDDQQRIRSICLLRGLNYQPMSLDYRPLKTSNQLLVCPPAFT